MGGKGKGKGGPPPLPPSGEDAARRKAELDERREREKQEARERIARAKEMEAKQRALRARAPTLRGRDIAAVPWAQALAYVHLSGGKGTEGLGAFDSGDGGGVDLVELPDGAVCVRKGRTLVTETIAEALAVALDVRVARMRLVDGTSDEGALIQETLKRLACNSFAAEVETYRRRCEEQSPDMLELFEAFTNPRFTSAVLEFVPGLTLDCAREPLRAPSLGLLEALGRLLGLDLLINNMDRFRLPCWNSAGNLKNAIVTPAGDLVGIDQQVNRIESGPGLDAYLASVHGLSGQLFGGPAPAIASSVRAVLAECCGAELSAESINSVLEGMRAVLREATRQARSGRLAQALDAAAATAGEIRFSHSEALSSAWLAAKDVAFVHRVVAAVMEALQPESEM